MTSYTLTNLQNIFNGGNGTDFFSGAAGGLDSLNGNGGNDFFAILEGQLGSINGGTGYDRLHLTGPVNNELSTSLTITGVEELILDATNLYATVNQLKGFTHFGINNGSDQFSFFLQGAGGALDFSNSFTEPQRLNVEAVMATSGVSIVGSNGVNQMLGSDFNDSLSGRGGNDTIYGGAGNDTIAGGLGVDYFYGDDGQDSYVFNTKPSGPVDHLGDFRPADDRILLDDAVFKWAGQTLGQLTASAFKVIGTGQTIDANDRIIYNQQSGVIFYDEDGSGAGKPALAFAVADNFAGDVPVLTFQDFFII